MPDNVSISYRGAMYALGQGPQFYGIWYATALQMQPLEWWPLTPEGWTAAWSRFASVETPGTIRPVTPPPVAPTTGPTGPALMTGPAGPAPMGDPAGPAPMSSPAGPAPMTGPAGPGPMSGPAQPAVGAAAYPSSGTAADWRSAPAPGPIQLARNARIPAALIGVGLVLGIVGLFPVYTGGASLASEPVNLVPHVIYLAGWTLSAILILLGGVKLRVGALIGLGTSAVTLGLFIADAGTPAADGAHGAGLVLGILGWLGCSVGVVLATVTSRTVGRSIGAARSLAGRFGAQPSHDLVPLVTLMLAALGAAIAFAPAWDTFTLRTASGVSQTVTAGNAFSNPGAVIAGDVLTMIALVAVVVAAALWRPLRLGAALAIGAAIPMVAQAISAIVQITEPASPLQFGISSAQAARLGLTIDAGLTPMFWVFCAFLCTLILLCGWMLLAHGQAVSSPAMPGGYLPGGHLAGERVPGGQVPVEPKVGAASEAPAAAANPVPGGDSGPPSY